MNEQISIKNKLNFKSFIITNSFVLIFSSLIIKIISLLNRVFLTRLLGDMGIAVYTLILPTVMLFISIGGFSLNNSITKIISENKDYSEKAILKISCIVALISSIITIIVFVSSIYFIACYALKQPQTLKPLLWTIPFIPLTALNNVFRGYVAGKNEIKKMAFATTLEQIARFLLTIILLIIFSKFNIYFCVMLTIIAMCFGEFISLIYVLYKIKRIIKTDQKKSINNKETFKKITKLSFSTTLTHLVSNFALFLEPIIFTFILSKANITSDSIILMYSEFNSFVLPTLTLLSFISFQYSQSLFPVLSNYYANNEIKKITNIMEKSLYLLSIISIFISLTFYFHAKEILDFLYNSANGIEIVKELAFIFILSYLLPLFITFLQATNNYSFIFISSVITTIIKLITIPILGVLKVPPQQILPISMIFYIIIAFVIYYLKTNKVIKLKIKLLKPLFLILSGYLLFTLFTYFNLFFILKIIVCLAIYFLFVFLL